ncbi:hypothetical protein PAMA111031_05465 [Paraphotobacterium marinum]
MKKYPSASDIAQTSNCPHSFYLQYNKYTISQYSKRARKIGIKGHERLNRSVKKKTTKIHKVRLLIMATIIVCFVIWFNMR